MRFPFVKWLVLSIASILINLILNNVIHFDTLLYNSISEQFSNSQIEQYLEFQDEWQWLTYIFTPLVLLIKTLLISSVIYIGSFFLSKIPLTFKQIWNIVLTAEFVFLLIGIIKIIWFYFFQTNYTLKDIQYFYPFSALNIVGYEELEPWLIYPFQVLNLFELGYWLILAYNIGKAAETTMDNGLKIVAYSYGSSLLLWLVVVMFFTLNYS
jgi:hypothetical protein